jgi:hypothetical protein
VALAARIRVLSSETSTASSSVLVNENELLKHFAQLPTLAHDLLGRKLLDLLKIVVFRTIATVLRLTFLLAGQIVKQELTAPLLARNEIVRRQITDLLDLLLLDHVILFHKFVGL